MPNWAKVALWELKRNLTISFLIGLLLTPAMMFGFGAVPNLLARFESERVQKVYVIDEVGLYEEVKPLLPENFVLQKYAGTAEELLLLVKEEADSSYIVFSQETLAANSLNIYTAQEGEPNFGPIEQAVNAALRNRRIAEMGLDHQTAVELIVGRRLSLVSLLPGAEDPWAKAVPGAFAGIILFSLSVTGMMIFQSATQEKKDKMAELLLSAISPNDMMQGKIVGYYALGLIQAFSWVALAVLIAIFYYHIPVHRYLFVPTLPIMLFFALLGNLMFSALYVAMGATIDDLQEASNFQGLIMMLPWLPLLFFVPVLGNPNGIISVFGSYIPLTSPGVMTLRLALLTRIPVWDVVISGTILLASTYLTIKLAGKVFRTGMLLYGKSATTAEIWRWIRQ